MRRGVLLALVVAATLAVGAVRINSHSRDWRDGLPGPAVPVLTGPVTVTGFSGGVDVIASDQARLAYDLRGSYEDPQDEATTAIRDTAMLIADLKSIPITATRRAHELHEALLVATRGRCAHCASLLHAAGVRADTP
jgi:hypothetical protein